MNFKACFKRKSCKSIDIGGKPSEKEVHNLRKQRGLRSACAVAQADLSLHFLLYGILRIYQVVDFNRESSTQTAYNTH